jgi:hypothetical protein
LISAWSTEIRLIAENYKDNGRDAQGEVSITKSLSSASLLFEHVPSHISRTTQKNQRQNRLDEAEGNPNHKDPNAKANTSFFDHCLTLISHGGPLG